MILNVKFANLFIFSLLCFDGFFKLSTLADTQCFFNQYN